MESQNSNLESDVTERRARVNLISENFVRLFQYGGALNDDTSDTQWYRTNIDDKSQSSMLAPASESGHEAFESPSNASNCDVELPAAFSVGTDKSGQTRLGRVDPGQHLKPELSVPDRLKTSETMFKTYQRIHWSPTEDWQQPTLYSWSSDLKQRQAMKAATSRKEQRRVEDKSEHVPGNSDSNRRDKAPQMFMTTWTTDSTTMARVVTQASGSATVVIHPIVALVHKLSLSMSGINTDLLYAVRDRGRLQDGREPQPIIPNRDFWDDLDAEVYSLPGTLKKKFLVDPLLIAPNLERESRLKTLCHLRESPILCHPLGTRDSAHEASKQYVSALWQTSPKFALSTPIQYEQLILCDQLIYATGHLRSAILRSDVGTLEELSRLLADTLLSLEVLICIEKLMRYRVLKRTAGQSKPE